MSLIPTLRTLLEENGPMPSDELSKRLNQSQPDWSEEELEAASAHGIVAIYDEIWVLRSWATNRIFTHRISQAEIDADVLPLMPDWHVPNMLTSLGSDILTLTDGTQAELDGPWRGDLEVEVPDELSHHEALIIFPRGYLASRDVQPGDLVGLSQSDDQYRWHLEAIEAVRDANPELTEALAQIADGEGPVSNVTALWDLLWRTETFTEPLAPYSDLIADAGLVEENDHLAHAGFDFRAYYREERVATTAQKYGISVDQAASVVDVVGAAEHSSLMSLADGDPTPEFTETASILTDLADIYVAESVWFALRESYTANPEGMVATLDALGSPPRRSRAAVLTLRALIAERAGDVLGAERLLHDALSVDPRWPSALVGLARFESDRGNAQRSLELLTRAGASEHPLAEVVAGFVASSVPEVGRNQPCPCGSGKKYKQCHLGRSTYPMPERAYWLSRKALTYVDTVASHLLVDIIMCRIDAGMSAEEAMGDATAFDIALFEGGLFEQFLEERGVLLPADELELGQQWLDYPRALHEVVSTRPGEGLRVRNVATGEEIDVVERTASKTLQPGMYFASRVVPVGDRQWNIYGGVEPVSLPMRQAVMEVLEDPQPDPLEVCEILSVRFAPPTVVSSNGESLTVCTGLIDPGGDIEELDAVLEPNDDGWLDLDGQTIRAWVRIEGANLRVEAMTSTRFAQAIALIRSVLPDAQVLEESQQPIDITRSSAPTKPPVAPAEMSEDEQDYLEQIMRTMEDRWVGESIPALEGYTPRQAAQDPTRRDDLIRLLDSFPTKTRAGEMDPDRLRRLLGL